jgi:hypothetical protein
MEGKSEGKAKADPPGRTTAVRIGDNGKIKKNLLQSLKLSIRGRNRKRHLDELHPLVAQHSLLGVGRGSPDVPPLLDPVVDS